MLATVGDPGYKIGVFVHVLAVVLAFGPTFAYAIFFSVAPSLPRSTPGLLAGIQKTDRILVEPGLIVVLLAGIYLLTDGPWETSDVFIGIGFLAIVALLGLQHAYFKPKVREARELAERDMKSGDVLSAEFEALSRKLGLVGATAGVIIVVAVFFMTYKPFI